MTQRPYASFDTWEWWQLALTGGGVIGADSLPVHADKPHTGFYRTKRKGQLLPVAIWRDEDGQWVGVIDRKGADERAVLNVWSWCCTRPISQAEYDGYITTGQWLDVDAAVSVPDWKKITPPDSDEVPPPIGHNAPIDEAEILKDQIATALENVSLYAEVNDDVTAAKGQSLRSLLNEYASEAVKKHKTEKEPHLRAGQAVDLKWNPLRNDAKAGADTIAKSLSAFETRKAQAVAAARKKAEEEARLAEAASQPAPPPYVAPAPSPAIIKGGYGKAASVKVVKVITGVTDWDALWAYLKGNPEVDAVLLKVAQQFVNQGHAVPGVTIEEQRKVA